MESCASECTNSSDQLDFVVAPPLDRFCPVCTELLTEPFLSDCGHHVCRECHKRIMASGNMKCPTCQEPNVLKTARLNKHLQREIYDLEVHCQNRKTGNKRGCQWIGELRELDDHLNPTKKRCEYTCILLVCSFGCGEQVLSGDMKDHKKLHCPKQQEKCKHCDYYNSLDIVMENHLPVCLEFPVVCPNKCREKDLKRRQLKAHIDECPLQVIECPFSSAGCTVKLPRNQIETHEDIAMRQHLRLVATHLSSKQQESIPQSTVICPQHLYNIAPLEFIMAGFNEKKQADKVWTSPPYYTHIGGYKFCLEVYPNGDGSGKSTHLSVYVRLMEGEHDDELEWTFEGWMTVKLLNQKTGNHHYRRKFVFNGQTNRIGFTEFISHTDLNYSATANTEYLQDDCLRMRVSTIARIVSVSEFTEFSEHKQSYKTYYSQPFYTHPQGYKLCLTVNANGESGGLGTHVSVYATLMRGEHDQHLQWPFTGELIIEVLNWRENKGHHWMTLPIISDDGLCSSYWST